MTLSRAALVSGATLLVVALGATAFLTDTRRRRVQAPAAVTVVPAPVLAERKIKVRLFYVSDDGTRLTGVERDIPFAEGLDQAREIIAAQLTLAPSPLVSAVPPGTSLRSLYITDAGEAYVDLSHEVVTAHTGGTLDELLTVYTIVEALTENLPAVHSVQILVDGKEVRSLAGHVDLRRPLEKNLGLVQ